MNRKLCLLIAFVCITSTALSVIQTRATIIEDDNISVVVEVNGKGLEEPLSLDADNMLNITISYDVKGDSSESLEKVRLIAIFRRTITRPSVSMPDAINNRQIDMEKIFMLIRRIKTAAEPNNNPAVSPSNRDLFLVLLPYELF